MRVILYGLSVLTLAILVAGPTPAEDKKDAAKTAEKKDAPKADPAFNIDKRITLDEKQQAQLEELKKEYGPKLKEIGAKIDVVMTPDRKKVAAEARKKAADDGKKGKELNEAVTAALNLNTEDAAKLKEAQAERQKLVQEINKKKMEILTEEQKKTIQSKPKDK
jgi:hypothetical protein